MGMERVKMRVLIHDLTGMKLEILLHDQGTAMITLSLVERHAIPVRQRYVMVKIMIAMCEPLMVLMSVLFLKDAMGYHVLSISVLEDFHHMQHSVSMTM